ncbi:carbohydrate ABC transporter permease [Parasphaerochaeta coccoides]|uniref:Carbohydrate ABC transporter membrane protein 2, CUT1 family n=1 Tax=Parasphaerochaeta coccoides (strain ATCC BAA-1237 / DSM 17374 / SPN1) TaxID=760011 RepID=F4GJ81_PARC1|nr:carbohydrate ABC transporter permease [Parasphaerochaeta coccoides]AEC01721.1 carbohydrate ABC transporter membrane protein 2, CUT1 family [Parasphaerochaeta coccoides DSM 17374]
MRKNLYVNSDTFLMFFIHVTLAIICVAMLYPLVLVLSNSVSDPVAIVRGQVKLLPVGFSFESYRKVFQNQDIVRSFANSLRYTVIGTLLNVIMTVLAAYPLSRRDLVGRSLLMKLITFTMFFSGGIIPLFLVVRSLGMMNRMWAIIVPGVISTYNLIITRTYFQHNIPQELQDAALIDGCSNTKFLLRIVLPLSTTILVIIAMFYTVGHWNAYLGPIMYFSRKVMYPLQVILRDILQSAQSADMATSDTVLSTRFFEIERIKYATIVIASLPMVIAYPFIMKYFEKGIMMGAIKG